MLLKLARRSNSDPAWPSLLDVAEYLLKLARRSDSDPAWPSL
jgi:hypothetical protein